MAFETEQEKFWAGEFGDQYIERNKLSPQLFASLCKEWCAILSRMSVAPKTILEFGANIGNNLHVLHTLLPDAQLSCIEINHTAAETVRQWGKAEVFEQSILDPTPPPPSTHTHMQKRTWDMTFTSGVLVHINPDKLQSVYEKLYDASARYICVAEYYNPTPEEVAYRGHREKMYRRDFAGEMLAKFPTLTLRGYGMVYRRDPVFPSDDYAWFLMEK